MKNFLSPTCFHRLVRRFARFAFGGWLALFFFGALGFWSLPFSEAQARAEFFSPDPGTPIYGQPLTESDLEGKTVLFVFWGVNSPECRQGLGRVAQIQSLLKDSDDLVILGSHLEETSPEVEELLEETHCEFTVYDHFIPDCVTLPEGDALKLPLIFLFQEDGSLAASGTPDQITGRLPETFRKRIEARARAGFRYAPLTELTIPEGLEGVTSYFAPNRSWQAGFAFLDRIIEDPESELATDAQILRDQLLVSIYDELEWLESLAETRPGEAAYRLSLLRRNLLNLDPCEDADELLEEFRERRGVSEMISVYSQIAYLRSAAKTGGRPRVIRSQAESVRSWLYSLSKSKTYDETIQAEAALLLKIANEKLRAL